jgi:autoinducer 2 (AI-2) kinase
MSHSSAYLIIDIGTGNARAAVVTPEGRILSLKRENVPYEKDADYPESIYFDPKILWEQIRRLSAAALAEAGPVHIRAITATSQREGIVVIDHEGKATIGLPNIDHRGREWENIIRDKSRMYQLTGRYPTSLFSAMKLVGLRARKPELWNSLSVFTSISDWVQYEFSGVVGYEHSQASETLLYDVAQKKWTEELCSVFSLPAGILPELKDAGAVLGTVKKETARDFGIAEDAVVIVGGSDTQLAVRSIEPEVDDVVIVSGTTTPIIKLTDSYVTDQEERTWTGRHVDAHNFMLEANAGVTGLNYQRLKEIFYPNEGYEVIERELDEISYSQCVASLGSLVADEDAPLTKGGFIFNAPVSHQLTRGSFVFAILWDIACSIYENYKSLCEVTSHDKDFVWACGGGVQSRKLRQFIANLFDKKIRIRDTFRQSSVLGGVFICNEALGIANSTPGVLEEVVPQERGHSLALYDEWKAARLTFKQVQ